MKLKREDYIFGVLFIGELLLVVFVVLLIRGQLASTNFYRALAGMTGIATVILFFWMGKHCVSNVMLNRKHAWLWGFLLIGPIAAPIYYIYVYRQYDDGRNSFAQEIVKKRRHP